MIRSALGKTKEECLFITRDVTTSEAMAQVLPALADMKSDAGKERNHGGHRGTQRTAQLPFRAL